MEAGIKTWMRSKLMLEQDFDQNVTQVFWILSRSRWVMLRRLDSRCHKKFQMTHFVFCSTVDGHRLKIPTESERGHGNMSVDVLETGLPQCIYLVQATLSIYVDNIFLHSSTFGQSCCLSFLNCKYIHTGKESSLHWFKLKNLQGNEIFGHWF